MVFCEDISQFGEGLQFICQEYGVPTVWLPTIHPNLIEQRQFSYNPWWTRVDGPSTTWLPGWTEAGLIYGRKIVKLDNPNSRKA